MSYIEKAQQRAKRRKSKWNLLLIPGVIIPLVAIWYLSFQLLEFVHGIIYIGQNFTDTSRGIGPIIAAVAPLFGTIPVSFLLGNTLVWLISPARRVLETEASNVPGTSFVESQKDLLRLAYVLVPISYGLAFIGAFLPWYK
jgi:hypothetical protein